MYDLSIVEESHLVAAENQTLPAPRRRESFVELLRIFSIETLIVGGAALAYTLVRAITKNHPVRASHNADWLWGFEKTLGINIERAVQSRVLDSGFAVTVANWLYVWCFWPIVGIVLGWLLSRHRVEYRMLRNAMLTSGVIGLMIFAFFPVAPPRLQNLGLKDTVVQQSKAFDTMQVSGLVNHYAALPSMHAGWILLIGLAIIRVNTRYPWLRYTIGILLPLSMVYSIIATANHYVIDALVGDILVLSCWLFQIYRTNRRPRQLDISRILNERFARSSPESIESADSSRVSG